MRSLAFRPHPRPPVRQPNVIGTVHPARHRPAADQSRALQKLSFRDARNLVYGKVMSKAKRADHAERRSAR